MTAFKYYLGLDMGTNSVGWAATDPGYRLLKAKGKDLWGIREFNEASGAVERRTHRISRRRRQREQVRIGILKDYFHDAICEVDPSFFQRLENSKYHEEDKDVEVRYKNNIFNDSNYTDKDYFNEYPTIYHLRNELISSTEKHDVRLVFLALLNMFKHRGHFLNAGLGENNGESNIDNAYFELTELLSELTEYHLSQDIDCKQIEAILSRRDMSRTHKAEELAGVLHVDLKNKPYKELIRGLCGLKFNACVVFPDVQSEEVTKLDICLSESTFDEKSDEIANIIGEDYFEIIMAMKEMFDIGSLASIMKGHNYLSQARVASYTKHKEDLKLLKEVIKKYCGKKEYDKFFNSDADGSYDGMIYDVDEGTWIDMPEVHPDGFDRSAAEEVWSYVNAERTAAGLNALTWDEDIYNFACQRAQAIVSDFSHNGCGNYGENIALNSAGSAYRIHMQWFYSTGHHNNYMLSSYVKGACAIYVYQGVWYAVENFALEESENSGGTLSCNAYGLEAEAALNEYIDSHDW